MNLLSSVPTREKNKPRNYTTFILVGFIVILVIALSGISGLYYLASQTTPTVILVNQTENNSSSHQSNQVEDTISKVNKQKDKQNTPTSNQDTKNKKTGVKSDSEEKRPNNST